MRTTVSIDDNVLEAVRKVSRRQKKPLGVVVTNLLREALSPKLTVAGDEGLPLMPVQLGAGRASLEIVNALRDDPA